MTSKDYNWFLTADLSKYKGEYVIIFHQRVALHGKNLKKLLKEFRNRHPKETPKIAKVPEGETLILLFP